MSHERSRGLFGRLRSLIRGIFAIWVRDTERQNPRAVYEQAINEKTKQFDCPCHASSFSIDGKKLFGPSPRDMIPATYEVTDGKVVVSGFETTA